MDRACLEEESLEYCCVVLCPVVLSLCMGCFRCTILCAISLTVVLILRCGEIFTGVPEKMPQVMLETPHQNLTFIFRSNMVPVTGMLLFILPPRSRPPFFH